MERTLQNLPFNLCTSTDFPGGSACKASACNVGDTGDMGSLPGSERPPWKRKWLPTPVFLPGESHEHRSLVGYSLWGCKESNMTEQLTHRQATADVSVQFSSVAQSCPTLCDPMNSSTPGLPVHHQLPEFTQTHVY